MSSRRLRQVASVNPPTPEFDLLADDDEVSFVPLERVWPNRFDPSELRPKAAVTTGYTRFRDGDIIVPKITPTFQADRTLIASGLHGGIAAGTTELHVVRPHERIEPRYIRYLLSTRTFLHGGASEMIGVAGQKRVPDSWLRDTEVPTSDIDQQRRIADFLDAETSRIDALITAKQQMAVELTASQVEVQDHACLGDAVVDFQGLAPRYVKVRPGWGATWLRHLRCEVQTGPFGSQLHAEEYVEDGWPVVNPANLREGRIARIAGMSVSDEKRSELRRHMLEPDDIVFGRRGEMGRAGLVEPDHVGWLCGTGSLRLRLNDDRLMPQFLKHQLESTAARSYFLLQSVGSTMDNLNADIVLGVPLVLPPIAEQEAIIKRIRRSQARTTAARATLTRQIELLRERRQALITAAVSGEMTV